jgi:hypothetical protein
MNALSQNQDLLGGLFFATRIGIFSKNQDLLGGLFKVVSDGKRFFLEFKGHQPRSQLLHCKKTIV